MPPFGAEVDSRQVVEDMQVAEDREPFYDISAAGLMDEEQI